ncbi:hypothetical protein [Parasulfitobacter algicola]|uniref:Uncharacterized protein n=1 Tax=Parasulfitobacter algicola TaxID=2614809 RepID=A0ABX2INK7_9RHOB|nr:hypothetical protein [Sulfitobacter algicola]NSX54467.1 hypothetical protein [Sulfitobacter algicola]
MAIFTAHHARQANIVLGCIRNYAASDHSYIPRANFCGIPDNDYVFRHIKTTSSLTDYISNRLFDRDLYSIDPDKLIAVLGFAETAYPAGLASRSVYGSSF